MNQKSPIKLVGDDEGNRAVSPVIGTILMVAITVILASVISVAVLTHVDTLSDDRPHADFDLRYTEDTSTAVITYLSGGDLQSSNVEIFVPDSATVTQPFTGTIQPGDIAHVEGLEPGDSVAVVWNPSSGRGYVIFRTTV